MAVTKWLIILPQPYFNWDIPLKDYLTFISIDLVWIPNNLAALEGNERPQSAPPPAPPTGRAPTPWAMMLRLFRNCTPFALRALPSVGGSSAMRNEKNQIYFVLNLYRHLPRLGRRVKPCCARKGSPGNGISIFPSLCIYILFIII